MEFAYTSLQDVVLIRPRVFGDERGFFMETWQERKFAEAGIRARFVQDNHSRSRRGVLRGLHYQLPRPQGKLVRVTSGAVYDVAVDLRRASPTFGRAAGFRLDAERHEMLWVPEGFAHGFLVLSEAADVLYKVTDFWSPDSEHTLHWNDPAVEVDWPIPEEEVIVNDKDRDGQSLDRCPKFP